MATGTYSVLFTETSITNTSTDTKAIGISLGILFLILLLLLPVTILCFFYKRKMFKNIQTHHPAETVRTERLYQEVTHDTVNSIVQRSRVDQPPTENVQLNHYHEVPQGTAEPLPEAASPCDITTHPSLEGDATHLLQYGNTTHPSPHGETSTSYVDDSELETTYNTLQYTRSSQEDTHTPVDTQELYENINSQQATLQALYSTLDVSDSSDQEHRIVNGCVYAVVTNKSKPKAVKVESMAEDITNGIAEGTREVITKSTTENINVLGMADNIIESTCS